LPSLEVRVVEYEKLGLTEKGISTTAELPMCPGTSEGLYSKHITLSIKFKILPLGERDR
jgi:hypothetical protein